MLEDKFKIKSNMYTVYLLVIKTKILLQKHVYSKENVVNMYYKLYFSFFGGEEFRKDFIDLSVS